jgi:alpha-tubulin suppressor-like RCC1 family protein
MRLIAIRFFLLLCLICPALASAVTPMVAAGYAHTVALKSDGTVEAWGDNSYGQLGTGNLTAHLAPVKGLTGVMAVAAGDSHTVALKSDGTVWAWGDNSYGQLGDGTQTARLKPKELKGLANVIAVAAGMGHTVALKADHTVMVWGSNPEVSPQSCSAG